MVMATGTPAPCLASFLKGLKTMPLESAIEQLISLLKRRQIRSSKPCALATVELLRQVVINFKSKDVAKLLARVRQVGNQIATAQPRELVVGNIVRRILGMIREVAEQDAAADTLASDTPGTSQSRPESRDSRINVRPALSSTISTFSPLKQGSAHLSHVHNRQTASSQESRVAEAMARPPLLTSHTSYATPSAPSITSLFGIFSQPDALSGTSTPRSPYTPPDTMSSSFARLQDVAPPVVKDIRSEVMSGIAEILDELEQVDEQIAGYALDYIHSNEIVLTQTSSLTIQKFLLAAARKRKFTVVHVESYPNDSDETHDTLLQGGKDPSAGSHDDSTEERFKSLTSAGIVVIMIPDSTVFAIMSRINKVILATHIVLANGGLIAACGARLIAKAARVHQTPVVVLTGVYKLSPIYPFDTEDIIEWGDEGAVSLFRDGDFVDNIEVTNALYDYVPVDLVDLYVTNLGGHAPSYLYRIVADHYHVDDIDLNIE